MVSEGTNFWVIAGRYMWWVFLYIQKMDFGFRRSWVGRKQGAQPLVSIIINRHFIYFDWCRPRPKVAKYAGVYAAWFQTCSPISSDLDWWCRQLQPVAFLNFGLRVPQLSKWNVYWFWLERVADLFAFFPSKSCENRSPFSEIAENTHYLYRPSTTQKLFQTDLTIHFK